MMPLILRYAVPSVISMLTMTVYNITDQVFIGHVVGMLGNAATNVAFPTVTLTTGVGMLFGIGTAANFSINQGAGKPEESKRHVLTGLTSSAIMGIIMGILILIFRSQIIVICGADRGGNVFPYALSYLSITAVGLPFHLFNNANSNVIRADGSPGYSMLCVVSGALLNIFLDWLFMFPLNMGIQGAAIATVIGQCFSTVLVVSYFTGFKSFKIRLSELKVEKHYLLLNMKTGIPNFCNHMVMMLTNITLNNMLAAYGALSVYGADIPLAVSGVAAKLNTIAVAFAVGTAQGCQPIWGFNLGAGNYTRVKGAYWRAFGLAFGIGAVYVCCLQLFPRQIISIFGPGSDLYFEFAIRYLRTYMMLVFLQNIQPVTINYFSATGNAGQGIIVSLSRQGLFLIPLLVILPKFMGIGGILIASPVSDVMAFVLSVTMTLLSFRKMDRGELDR